MSSIWGKRFQVGMLALVTAPLAVACGGDEGESDPVEVVGGSGGEPRAPDGKADDFSDASAPAPDASVDEDPDGGGLPISPDAAAPSPDAAPVEPDEVPEPMGLPALGGGTHDAEAVEIVRIASRGEGLSDPRDLAFNPDAPDQLWIVNQRDNSVVVLIGAGTEAQRVRKFRGLGGEHFISRVAGLAFGDPGIFATAHEEDEITQISTPANFMGPTLWTSDLEYFDAGHASHLDMLHNSPNAVGIAWERENVYWVFDGFHQALSRYNFNADHGLAGEDHSDGQVLRYVEGEVAYVPGIPSGLEMDRESGLLYVADTGNARVAVLDPQGATRGRSISPNYDGGGQYHMGDVSLRTLVGDGLEQPSGLALHDGVLYVADNGTRRILAYDLEGRLIDWLPVDSRVRDGGLMGIELDGDGNLYVVDGEADAVFRISPR